MGFHRHHAIVVTSWQDEGIEAAHAAAVSGFADTYAKVTPITDGGMNAYRSFMVAPDGSKEGWGASDEADAAREAFIDWLMLAPGMRLYVEWAEVTFGGDEPKWMAVRGCDGVLDGEVLPAESTQEGEYARNQQEAVEHIRTLPPSERSAVANRPGQAPPSTQASD